MNLIKNSEMVEEACKQFLESHPCHYNFNSELIHYTALYPHLSLKHQDITTTVRIGREKICNDVRLHFVENRKNMENCVVYLHGLSSYCMEGRFLIPLLGDQLSLCLFDSRGHGKNKSKFVTYGLLESEELGQVIDTLVRRGFKNIIIWGRSMGAVTALRFIQKEGRNSLTKHVKYVVADAPFFSFKTIATDIVSQSTKLPQFLSQMLADTFAQKIKEKHLLDLRDIDLEHLSTSVPVYFLYSNNDQLMGDKHVLNILKKFKGNYQANNIKVNHNDQRPVWVIQKIMTKISQVLKSRPTVLVSSAKKRGLSITKDYLSRLSECRTPNPTNHKPPEHFLGPQSANIANKQLKIQINSHPRSKAQTNRPAKQNIHLKHSNICFRGQLGGSIVKQAKMHSKMLPAGKQRKVTISQFMDD